MYFRASLFSVKNILISIHPRSFFTQHSYDDTSPGFHHTLFTSIYCFSPRAIKRDQLWCCSAKLIPKTMELSIVVLVHRDGMENRRVWRAMPRADVNIARRDPSFSNSDRLEGPNTITAWNNVCVSRAL